MCLKIENFQLHQHYQHCELTWINIVCNSQHLEELAGNMCMQTFFKPASDRRCSEFSLGTGWFSCLFKLSISEDA